MGSPLPPPGPTDGEGLCSRRSVPDGQGGCPPPRPRRGRKPPPVLLARLAMLLAQRSPPARQRLRGPKGRCSRRRPRARAGDPRRDGTAPPPHRPHHRTMPRRGRRCGEDAGGWADGEKFEARGRGKARKGAGGQGVGRRGRMGGWWSCPRGGTAPSADPSPLVGEGARVSGRVRGWRAPLIPSPRAPWRVAGRVRVGGRAIRAALAGKPCHPPGATGQGRPPPLTPPRRKRGEGNRARFRPTRHTPPLPGGERSAEGRERGRGPMSGGSPSPAALRASTSPRRGEVKGRPTRRSEGR